MLMPGGPNDSNMREREVDETDIFPPKDVNALPLAIGYHYQYYR